MSRRHMVFLGALIAAAAAVLPARLAAQAITAAPGGQLSSLTGTAFDVPIVVDMSARSDQLGAFAARLTWNPSRLRFDASSAGTFGSATIATDSVAQGILRLAGANPAGAGGVVSLSVLRFTPLVADTATLSLAFSQLFAAQTFANLLSSLTVSSRQFCPARGRFGDIDIDGTAGSRDALIALSAAVGINVAPLDTLLGDVDASGATNARDALGILTHAVGLPTPGFRVLALALGACAIGGPVTVQIAPGVTGSLVIGQFLQLEARAADGAGGIQSVPDAVWRSSNAAVLAVGPSGVANARAAGTAVITAVRAGGDSASLGITVVARRTRHFVDAVAIQSANQTGSAALPYGSLREAIIAAVNDDTIQVRQGRYDVPGINVAASRLVIVGDTTASGQRPLITGGSAPGLIGLTFSGVQDVTVQDLAFDLLSSAVTIYGSGGRLRLSGLRGAVMGGVLESNGSMDRIRIERTRMVGNPQTSGDAIELNGPVDTVVIEDTDISDFAGQMLFGMDVDSIAIRRSKLNDFGDNALRLDGIEALGRGVAISIDSSQLRRSGDDLLDIDRMRSLVVRWSTLQADNTDLFSVFTQDGHGFVRLHRDSLISRDSDWFDADGLDSVLIDSVIGDLEDSYGDFYNVGLIRVTATKVTGAYYFIEAGLGGGGPNISGARLEVRNSDIIGDPGCDRCGYGIETYDDIRVIVDSTRFVNLSEALYFNGDSSVTVTHSTFRHVWNAIEFYGDYSVGCAPCGNPGVTFTAQFNTFEDLENGIDAYDALIVVDSNTFANVDDEAIEVGSWSSVQVTRNRITGAYDGIYAELDDSSGTVRVEDNVLADIEYSGIEVDGDGNDTLVQRAEVRRNTVVCVGQTSFGYGLRADYTHLVATDNQVSGCGNGIQLTYFGSTTRTDTLLRNTIQAPSNGESGIHVMGSWQSLIRGNRLTGDSTAAEIYGMIRVSGQAGFGASARIERDTIVGGFAAGIHVSELDTVMVRHNVINDHGYFGQSGAAIELIGQLGSDTVRVHGNAIRRPRGGGVYLENVSSGPILFDSNLVSLSHNYGLVAASYGTIVVRRNTIDSSRSSGVSVHFPATQSVTIDSNNIQGNLPFGVLDQGAAVIAANNWWGHASGPSCDTGCGSGDSVSTNVSFLPVLTAPVGGAPPITAPPVFRPHYAGALMAAVSGMPAERRASPALRVRPARPARAVAPRPDVSGLTPELARQVQQHFDVKVAHDAAGDRRRSEREAARAAEREARRESRRVESEARERELSRRSPAGQGRRP